MLVMLGELEAVVITLSEANTANIHVIGVFH